MIKDISRQYSHLIMDRKINDPTTFIWGLSAIYIDVISCCYIWQQLSNELQQFMLAQAFIQQFGILFEFFWAFNIALAANKGYEQETLQQKSDRETFSYILGFLFPLILCLIPLINGDYSNSDDLCQSICFFKQGYICLLITFALPMMQNLKFNLQNYFCAKFNPILQFNNEYVKEDWKQIYLVFIFQIDDISYDIIRYTNLGIQYQDFAILNDNSQWVNYRIWCYFSSNLVGFLDVLAYGINAVYNNNSTNENINEFEQSHYISLEQSKLTICQ
ncbi:hypothetical protein pb186bvf_008840 [Paramecium bursaria]